MSCTLAPLSQEAKGEIGNDEPCPAVTSKLTSKILIKREISADSVRKHLDGCLLTMSMICEVSSVGFQR